MNLANHYFHATSAPWLFYTHHAIEQLNERGISTADITNTVREPGWRCKSNNRQGKNSIKFVRKYGAKELHVACAVIDGEYLVTTVFWKGTTNEAA